VTVLQAIDDEEIAGGIQATDVPGSKKVVPKGLRGPIRVVPVTEHHIRPASYEFKSCPILSSLASRPVRNPVSVIPCT
jgi:hypothetical protein